MITVQDLTKVFPSGGREIVAVDRLSFRVADGEVFGLLGPNGAGKTTTLRMILGLLEPTSGHAEVAGFRCPGQTPEVKRRIGLVSASAGLYPWLTPREILWLFADLFGVPAARAERWIAELISVFELAPYADRRSATLSTGQQQRVNLARALVHHPPALLLDEPTRGLDVLGSQVVFDYVNQLRRQGKAVIVCTHHLDEAQRLCDRFGLLHRGRLWREGTLAELQAATGRETLVEMFLRFLADPPDDAGPRARTNAPGAASPGASAS